MKDFVKSYNEGREKRMSGTPMRGVRSEPSAKKSIEKRSVYHKALAEKKGEMNKLRNK